MEVEKLDSLILHVPEEPKTSGTSASGELKKIIPGEIDKINRGLFLRFVVWACKSSEFGIERFSEFVKNKIILLLSDSKLESLRTNLAQNTEIQQLIINNKAKLHMFLENNKNR